MAEEQVETLQEDVQVQEAQAQAETPPEPQAQAQAEPRDARARNGIASAKPKSVHIPMWGIRTDEVGGRYKNSPADCS